MKKVKDRLILGMVSGLLGNFVKLFVEYIFINHLKYGRISGPGKAIGIFLPKWKLIRKNTEEKTIGYVTDGIIASMVGIIGVYILSLTGKDSHRWKAFGMAHFVWMSMYGFLGKVGNISTKTIGAQSNLMSLISHTVYGLVTGEAIVRLGDSGLFKPRLSPLGTPEEDKFYYEDLNLSNT